jgi:hypothetical protein
MSDDRSLQTPTAVPPDMGTAAPTIMPSGPVPVQTADTPNQITPGDNSNRPDASTPAANSIPAALVNNPQVPSQKIAAQVDANKNSDSPPHSMLYRSALEMIGDPKITTVAPDGTVTRKSPEVKPWQLGLALALQVLAGGIKGGIAGGNAPDSVSAAQAGVQAAAKQRAGVQAANDKQADQAISDQDHKLKVTEANMRMHQNAMLAGAASEKVANTLGESTDFFTNGVLDGTIPLGDMTHKEMEETDAAAAVANGQSNVTKDYHIAFGPAKPALDPKTNQQLIVNGQPAWKHQYMVIHGAADGKIPLTKEMQDKFVKYGLMPAVPEGGIGTPAWPFASIAKNLSDVASIDMGEQLLKEHKDDITRLLDHAGTGGADGKGKEDLDDVTAQIAKDGDFRNALKMFAQAQAHTPGANHHIEDILNTMGAQSGQGPHYQALIMNHLGLSSQDLDDMHNKRTEAATAAGAEGKASAVVEPKTMGDALAMKYNPASTPAQQKWADGVIAGFNEQEKNKADTAADAAQAKEDYKQGLKDQRTMGYVEDQNGDVYHVSRWQADHMPNYSAQTFIEKKPSDISADQKAIKPINDIQNNINGYRAANSAYDAAAKSNKVNVAGDRSNLTTIFSAPAITDAASAHAGVEGFGMTIPTLAADLNKDLAKKALSAYNALSPEGKTMADSYARMRGAIPAYVKVITNAGRGSKEQLDIELQNIMPPYFNQSDIGHRIETFQGNLDTQKAGFPKNLAGSHFVPTSGTSTPMFRRDPQTKAVQKSTDGGKSWQ